jgi:hypothetical protein
VSSYPSNMEYVGANHIVARAIQNIDNDLSCSSTRERPYVGADPIATPLRPLTAPESGVPGISGPIDIERLRQRCLHDRHDGLRSAGKHGFEYKLYYGALSFKTVLTTRRDEIAPLHAGRGNYITVLLAKPPTLIYTITALGKSAR